MDTYEFELIIEAPNLDEALLDALFEARCDDATIGATDGVAYAAFDREADSFPEALDTAVADLESVEGVRVRRLALQSHSD